MNAGCVNLPGHDMTNRDLPYTCPIPLSPRQFISVLVSLAMAWLQVCHLLAAHGKYLGMKTPRFLVIPCLFLSATYFVILFYN